jgi:hypothetical protein
MNGSPMRLAVLLIPPVLAVGWFALSPAARAVCQEGCDLAHSNTFLGDEALTSNTTGILNTATGADALLLNTTGNFNTATGAFALLNNTTGSDNTASGFEALKFNTTGTNNTATGLQALFENTTGNNNTATGYFALSESATGNNNTATGVQALYFNYAGNNDTASGVNALFFNSTGTNNTAIGVNALYSNTTGSNNTAAGLNALRHNTNGEGNNAYGFRALVRNTTGNDNIALGNNAGENLTTGNNNIEIGNQGVVGEGRTIRIGEQGTQRTTFIAGISGATVTGTAVAVNSSGQLGVAPSSARFKQNIQPMGDASDTLLALRPVTFDYKPDVDPKGIPQFGLVAEDVEKVNPDLVARDDEGKPYSVRYEAVNAMLLNEFLKEHRQGEQQDRKIEELEATVAKLQSVLKEQAAQIEKVTAALEARKSSPQIVLNNQ